VFGALRPGRAGCTTGGETVAVANPIEEGVRARVSQTTSISALSDEQHLIAAAKAGDQHAYGQLLQRHQAVALRAACLITGSPVEAEDATQDACVKAWLALRRFRTGAPFRPWLVRIAINEARNRRRGAGRRATLVLRLGPEATGAGSSPSAETEALASEERIRLATAVGRLREDDQLVIAARYFLGLSEAETAIALGLRRGTVKSRLSRALGRLQAELETTG
jgi:RNA polymerase sigma-70 factor (ECF subfamily)